MNDNKWRIIEQIGEGQHSKVYKIEQLIEAGVNGSSAEIKYEAWKKNKE